MVQPVLCSAKRLILSDTSNTKVHRHVIECAGLSPRGFIAGETELAIPRKHSILSVLSRNCGYCGARICHLLVQGIEAHHPLLFVFEVV